MKSASGKVWFSLIYRSTQYSVGHEVCDSYLDIDFLKQQDPSLHYRIDSLGEDVDYSAGTPRYPVALILSHKRQLRWIAEKILLPVTLSLSSGS